MKMLPSTYRKLSITWWMLRLTYAFLFMGVGIDKFFNTMVQWKSFLTPFVTSYFPYIDSAILYIFAAIQTSIGLLLLSKWYKIGIYAGLIMLTIIFFNLLTLDSFIVVVAHDVLMIIGMITLLILTDIRNEIHKEKK